MELADILSEESVLAYDKVRDKAGLLEILANQAAKISEQDPQAILEALTAREALGSTGLGNGIAIPHGKLPGLKKVIAVFARLAQPVEFDSVDDQPVDLAFMLLAPTGAGADHLKALARVARLLRTDTLVEALRSADDPAKLYSLLTAAVPSQNAA
ncbi:MAG TPA: PTS sugar transporter subunit IIA [Devosiaceae bacterium]|jgi:PTS system nitrogen regulatory IIA component|nr:PTS sugar transporter subunit IIA [Devosiaceae bacterium]